MNQIAARAREATERGYRVESGQFVTYDGTAVMLVEQDVGLAQSASDRLYCMLEGRVTLTGRSTEITRDQIGAAYFGGSHAVV